MHASYLVLPQGQDIRDCMEKIMTPSEVKAARLAMNMTQAQLATALELTDDDVRAIRLDDRPLRDIASGYGMHDTHISRIKRRMLWCHVV